MNYLSVEGLSKSYGIKTLFSDVTFGIEKGDKTALIASNGSGKSTLLRILVGKESMDSGTVTFANDIRVGYLEQLPQYDPGLTIQDVVAAGHVELMRVVARYEKALREHTDETDKNTKAALELAISEMDAIEAWSYEQRLTQLLTRFELTDLQQRIGDLSGGQVKFLKEIRIAFLEQDYDFEPEATLLEQVMACSTPFLAHLDAAGRFEYEHRIIRLLTDFGLRPDQRMNELSGGEVKRVAITQVLAPEADFLILDEPTNHLDVDAIEYLENYLRRSRCTLLMVTHDR
ncbi:MAG: ATP-binding cassette domain-containing protein, partial [Bacteroidales bacterium]|nr:ATP-binding cassette domain-containing protein [Bacteroidales bacterium]